MAKKKNRKKQPQTLKTQPRLRKARQWLETYDGSPKRIVRKYRDKFHVDIPTALRDLQAIGYHFDPAYLEAVTQGEQLRLQQKTEQKQEQMKQDLDWRNDQFYYIAGYTSGGAPYGVTWEQMGLDPYEDDLDLDSQETKFDEDE